MSVTRGEGTTAKLEPRVVVENGDAGFLIEQGETIAYVNNAYAAMLGYESPEQLVGRPLSVIVADEDAPRLLAFSRMRVRKEPAPRKYEFTARRRDLSLVRLQASVSAAQVGPSVVIATMVLPCEPREAETGAEPDKALATAPKKLSPREKEVMGMVLQGKRMKEIALALDISPKTATTHQVRLLQKLQLKTLRDLFEYAVKHRLVDWT